jgi:hypothetical protein
MTSRYFFGRVEAVRIDFFAFPRCGSHFLRSCTAGLLDLVALPHGDSASPEAAARQNEIDPLALYALNLREDGVPYQPVWFNATANGRHGTPVMSGHPVLILIRDPHAAVYSLYRVTRDRWNTPIGDTRAWAKKQFESYAQFYSAALALLAAHHGRAMLLRYEDLRAGPQALERLVAFVGVRPKLSIPFVHHFTRFGTFATAGARTFYREGDNEAWRRDEDWLTTIRALPLPGFEPFGYAPQ